MFLKRKPCPQCAERIRTEARLCRYCGHRFSDAGIVEVASTNWRLAGIAVAVLLVGAVGWLTYGVWSDLDAIRESELAGDRLYRKTSASIPEPEKPRYEQLLVGTTLEWVAKDSPNEVVRQAGPFVITITKKVDDELVAPLIKISSGSQSTTLEGAGVWATYPHKISLILNRTKTGPAIMLQSFTGGAHCCNSIQLAGLVDGNLKIVDLGSWDGDSVDIPKDVSGDGLVDFVMYDNSFLYAFASYADSDAPPKIFNVVHGEVKDVSRNAAFKPLFVKEMNKAAERCKPGLGMAANGACPAFVAAAARVGKLDQAWPQMLAAYDASSDWDLPTGCAVSAEKGCPSGAEIVYKSYPEALLAFLKREGYVSKSWLPPEAFQRTPDEESKPPEGYTA